MKTRFIVTLSLLFAVVTTKAQVAVGFFAPQATSAMYDIKNQKQKTGYKYGAQAGINLKIPFEGRLYFAPSLYYSLKGYKVDYTLNAYPPGDNAISNETTIHTIELAPYLHYDFSSKPGHFFVQAAPAMDYNVKGKEKYVKSNKEVVERDMKFSFEDYGYATASANIHFGYETAKKTFVFAHYAHGMGSLNNSDGGPRIRHRVIGISFGKYF